MCLVPNIMIINNNNNKTAKYKIKLSNLLKNKFLKDTLLFHSQMLSEV